LGHALSRVSQLEWIFTFIVAPIGFHTLVFMEGTFASHFLTLVAIVG
jgi:hypothetical protein